MEVEREREAEREYCCVNEAEEEEEEVEVRQEEEVSLLLLLLLLLLLALAMTSRMYFSPNKRFSNWLVLKRAQARERRRVSVARVVALRGAPMTASRS